MSEMEASIENLMDDEIMDLLLKADSVKRRDVWQVVGQARRALSDGDESVSSGTGEGARLSVFAETLQIRNDSEPGREARKWGHV